MNKIYKIGVAGLGEQSWDNLLPAIILTKRANITAVCDIDKVKLKRASTSYGATGYLNYKIMLDNETLDAIVVASFPQVHNLLLKEAIVRQIPIFVEKPPVLYTSDLEKLINLNKKYNTLTAVGLNFNFADPIKFVSELITKPEFGNLAYLRISHYGSKPNGTLWGLNSKAKSFLLAQAIHPLGFVYFLGHDTNESKVIRCVKNDNGLIFNINMNMFGPDNKVFTTEIFTTSMAPFFEWQLQLVSDNGVILNVNSLWEVELYSRNMRNKLIANNKWWRDTWKPSPLSSGFRRAGYENQFNQFFDCIAKKTTARTSIEAMLPLYKLMDEMEQVYENQKK